MVYNISNKDNITNLVEKTVFLTEFQHSSQCCLVIWIVKISPNPMNDERFSI